MGNRAAKDDLFDGFAAVAKALGNGRRAEIIDVLAQGERHLDDIAAEIGQSVANTSFHLRALAAAGLVTTRRDCTRMYYRLASALVGSLWAALRGVAATHHEAISDLAAAYLGDRRALEQIDREEVARRLADGDLNLIDVRPGRVRRRPHRPRRLDSHRSALSAAPCTPARHRRGCLLPRSVLRVRRRCRPSPASAGTQRPTPPGRVPGMARRSAPDRSCTVREAHVMNTPGSAAGDESAL